MSENEEFCEAVIEDIKNLYTEDEIKDLIRNLGLTLTQPQPATFPSDHYMVHELLYYITNVKSKSVISDIFSNKKTKIRKAISGLLDEDEIIDTLYAGFPYLEDPSQGDQSEIIGDIINIASEAFFSGCLNLRKQSLKSIITGNYTTSYILLRTAIELFLKFLLSISVSNEYLVDKANIRLNGRIVNSKNGNIEDYFEEKVDEFKREDFIRELKKFGSENFQRLDEISLIYKKCNKFTHQTITNTDFIKNREIENLEMKISFNEAFVDNFLLDLDIINDLIILNVFHFVSRLIIHEIDLIQQFDGEVETSKLLETKKNYKRTKNFLNLLHDLEKQQTDWDLFFEINKEWYINLEEKKGEYYADIVYWRDHLAIYQKLLEYVGQNKAGKSLIRYFKEFQNKISKIIHVVNKKLEELENEDN